MDGITLSSIVTDIGTVATGVFSWVSNAAETVVGQPLLLFGALVGFAPLGVSMFKKLFSIRA